jgi:hypothetical protein
MRLSIKHCYGLAWRSFSKWWIPLCLISTIVVVVQIVPRILVRADMAELRTTTESLTTAIKQRDIDALEKISEEVTGLTITLLGKLATYGLYLFPAVALLTVILLMCANWAVKNKKEKVGSISTLGYIAFIHVVLAIVKQIAFLFFFFPGVFLYIKLLFVSLIMLEQKKGAREAIRMSWQMTTGNFWKLFLLVLVNSGFQILSLPTIVGAIPVTGFANTARAAAFQMIWEDGGYADKQ